MPGRSEIAVKPLSPQTLPGTRKFHPEKFFPTPMPGPGIGFGDRSVSPFSEFLARRGGLQVRCSFLQLARTQHG